MRLIFLVPSLRLSGGLNVVVEHATRLATRHGFDVTLAITHHVGEEIWPYEGLESVRVVDIDDVADESFDLALATWWDTVSHLSSVTATQYAYFIQSLEDRFYPQDDPQSVLAGLTYRLGLPVVTEARWIAELVGRVDPSLPCAYVRNGINKDIFPEQTQVEPSRQGPLRVLIEGNPDDHIKGVPEAIEAIRRMSSPAEVTVVAAKRSATLHAQVIGPLTQRELSELYARTDVVLKLSRVEGMSGPPLEGFHRGATCVITPVTGHDEYLQHGWNGMLVGWDDLDGTARALDLLATDRRLLHFLRTNAAATARAWPSWEQSTTMMSGALRSLLAAPPVDIAAVEPLYAEARLQIARSAVLAHGHKVKLAADAAHIRKLEAALADAQHHAALRGAQAAALHDQLAEANDTLGSLVGSRWLRLLQLAERPVRRLRPGTGSMLERLTALRDVTAPR
jgi:glycosyltransferase involved in cell wall biosynthesis